MQTESAFAESIAQASRTLNQPRNLDETLQTIVEVACNSVPGCDQVGIVALRKDGTVETKAFTGDLVPCLDEIQYSLREGPCSAALQGTDEITVSSLQTEHRWPEYVHQARAVGVRSQMAVRLHLDGHDALGGMNFYSTSSDEVSPDAQALAWLFASHAALALGHARERHNLNVAMETRRVIGQAIGILMERHSMNEDDAFGYLVRASSHANIKLREVAQKLVDELNTP